MAPGPLFERGGGSTAATCSSLVLHSVPEGSVPVTGPAGITAASGVTAAQLQFLRGVTGPLQPQLSTTSPSGFVGDRVLVSAGNVAASDVTATQLGFLRGLSSSIQSQLGAAGTSFVAMPYSWKTSGLALADSPLTFTPEPSATYVVDAQLLVYANTTGHAVSYGVRWPSPLHTANAGLVTFAYAQAPDTAATLRSSSRVATPVCTLQTTSLANVPWMLSVRAVFSTAASANITPFAIVANTNHRSRWAHVLYGSHLAYQHYTNTPSG